MVHGKAGWDVTLCAFKVSSALTQFDHRSLIGFSDEDAGGVTREGWSVFCDGSLSWQERNGGWAAVLFWNRVIVECRTGYARDGVIRLQTEVNALVMGLKLVKKYRCPTTVVYSDCADAVWAIQRGAVCGGLEPTSLFLGLELLRTQPGWKLRHIGRAENHVANSLARRARIEEWRWNRADAIPLVDLQTVANE